MIQILIIVSFIFSNIAYADPVLSDIARNPDGSIRNDMTYGEAESFCATYGWQLPTAKDWAQYSISLGSEGIADTPKNSAYRLIDAKNANGTFDYFYFSSAGYQRPNGDLAYTSFWSSSSYPVEADSKKYIYFSGKYGDLFYYPQGYYFAAVRCVVSR